ncbi:MAG: aquaporin [Streptococcaceae bacterium]|jgi:glycerol uptake facilitator protein|nr:aquaporin [Streptococcaceae bacterium]
MDYSRLIQYLSEGIGTAIFVIILNLVALHAREKDTKKAKVAVGFGYGAGLAIAILTLSAISGQTNGPAFFNPAYTLGLAVSKLFPWQQSYEFIIAQVIGAIVGQLIVVALGYTAYREIDDSTKLLSTFVVINDLDDRTYAQRGAAWVNGALTEFIGSFIFFFGLTAFNYTGIGGGTISYMTSQLQQSAEQSGGAYSAAQLNLLSRMYVFGVQAVDALAIGLFAGILVATLNVSLNPARDLGPRFVHAIIPSSILGDAKDDSRWWYAWVPIILPIVAAIAAVALFKIIYQ